MINPLLLLKAAPLAALLAFCTPLDALAPSAPAVESITVEQLTALLAADEGKTDADIAANLGKVQLSERVSSARFARMSAGLPGEKSRQALAILADSAALLGPPVAEVLSNPTPDAAALRRMMVVIVDYANSKTHQLPNFVAIRTTTAFEDRPAEDRVGEGGVGMVSLSALPTRFVGTATSSITYRDGREVVDGKSAPRMGSHAQGLVTAGEFGPFLSTVLADAAAGKTTWGQWVQGTSGPEAVYRYSVPRKQSNYVVRFCCVAEHASKSFTTHVFSEQVAYHGEIQFDPASGAILRITAEAELPRGDLVSGASMVVSYLPVQIGARTVILPAHSVSLLQAHTARPRHGMTSPAYTTPPKTFLNDTVFDQYREYRGEVRVLTGENGAP